MSKHTAECQKQTPLLPSGFQCCFQARIQKLLGFFCSSEGAGDELAFAPNWANELPLNCMEIRPLNSSLVWIPLRWCQNLKNWTDLSWNGLKWNKQRVVLGISGERCDYGFRKKKSGVVGGPLVSKIRCIRKPFQSYFARHCKKLKKRLVLA